GLYRQIVRAGSLKPGSPSVNPDAIHKSLLSGLLARIGLRDERGKDRRNIEYLGARQQRFAIFPGSSLAKKPPAAVMAAELVETSRLFARTVAVIDPAWAEPLAGDLVKRSYGEPRWEKRQGSAVADERVTLYGVPIVPKRRIQLARIDPEQARELFIRHALVDGDWPHDVSKNGLYAFDRDNRALRAELGEVEERTRRRDILVDDEAVVDFYDRRVPAEVTDVRRFETWWKSARAEAPQLLTMTRGDLLAETVEADDDFPGSWRVGDQSLPLRYRFEPGADDDGITVEIPLPLLPSIEPAGFDWLVPGLREELVTALLRTLPKPLRRNLVPASDWARRLLPELDPAQPLTTTLAEAARRGAGTVIEPGDFDPSRLAPHLRMTFSAVDDRGRRIASSKSLGALQRSLAERTRSSVARVTTAALPGTELERTGLTSWDIGDLPRVIEAGAVRGYPALVDAGSSVAVRIFATADQQRLQHVRGVRRLIALTLPSPVGYVQDHLTPAERLQLAASPYPSTAALFSDALLTAVADLAGDDAPFEQAAFEALRTRVSAGLLDALFTTVAQVAAVLAAARETDRAISQRSGIAFLSPLTDARAQLGDLVFPGFASVTGSAQLPRIPVYLAGIRYRLERLSDNPGRDRAWQTEAEEATGLYRAAGGELPLTPRTPPRLVAVRWMLEELRISLFAQPLGARGPISVQRIRKALTG
ncbi:MAG TPA: DUF3418 domain-containing protein, partial [Pseudolysinimonas sp.]|nr:DUF3418 domain-containing protein [Pseudolysinimonas sp.]